MYKVQIKRYGTDEVVEEIKADSERAAERVDDGVNINLNHDRFYTVIVECEQ